MKTRGLASFRGHWVGILAIVLLTSIGIINLASADFYSSDAYHRTQLVWTLVASLVGLAAFLIDIRVVERNAYLLYGLILVLLVLTAAIGHRVNNSTRWIIIAGQQMQPSEFMKAALIIALARMIHRNSSGEPLSLRGLMRPAGLVGIPALLVVTQPDLGTTLVLIFISFSMLAFHGIRIRTLLLLLGLAGLVVPIAWEFDFIRGYQKDRVRLWLGAEELDPKNPVHKKILDKNLQTEQALWAIGSGQFVGKGLRGGARSRLKYLPEMHNDFIIATFAEEHGFIGCVALSGLYWVLVVWALGVARRARERFHSMIAVGFAAMVFWHFFVNVGMVTGMLPVVGLPLPLLSYGGSSALTILASFGLLLNVATSRVKLG